MKMRLVLWLAIATVVAACSSGGSGNNPATPMPPGMKTGNVRLVNAATRMGTLTFTFGAMQSQVPIRSAGEAVAMPAGSATFTVTNGTVSAMRTVTIDEGAAIDVVAFESPAGGLSLDSIFGEAVSQDRTKATVAYYNFADSLSQAGDAYVVPPGTDIASVPPTFPASSGTLPIAPGTYVIELAPAGSKATFFRSKPFTLGPGQQLVLIAAPESTIVLTPQPIVVTFGEPSSSMDNTLAPAPPAPPTPAPVTVKVLRRIDVLPPAENQPVTLHLNSNITILMPAPNDHSNFSYGVAPGLYAFTDAASSFAYSVQLPANSTYIQRFGWFGFTSPQAHAIWLPPDPAPDWPAPSDKARVRIIFDNDIVLGPCITNVIGMDGATVLLGNGEWIHGERTFDRLPGLAQIDVFNSGLSTPQGSMTLNVAAGHYYVVHAGIDATERPAVNCSRRVFEVSGDE